MKFNKLKIYHLERLDQSLGVQCRHLESMRILRLSMAFLC